MFAYSVHMVGRRVFCYVLLVVLLFICLSGCGPQARLPSIEQLAEFENAGPILPSVDLDRLMRAKIGVGPYRVVPGDVLELTIPAILQVVTVEQPELTDGVTPYACRVSKSGFITLPIVGEIEVGGKTLAEIELAVIEAYYPEYTATRPSVVAKVAEYRKAAVSITGAVADPGVYELQSDQMSLVTLLMQAGGIADEGAAFIHITHPDEAVGSIDKMATKKMPEQIFVGLHDQLSEPSNIEPAVYSADYAVSNEIELQLAFQQLAPPSTIGRLIIRRERAIVLTEELDITSEIQRRAALEKLARNQSRVSTAKVGRKLYVLANLLKPGSDTYSSQSQLNSNNINLNSKFNVSNPKRDSTSEDTLYEQLAKTYEQLVETLGVENAPGIKKVAEFDKLNNSEPIILPVRGLNIPFADVTLQDGDTVVVEPLEQQLFTVLGLVKEPGNFPYPSDAKYNLMQALAFAGGLDKIAEPRYATIYRLKADGTIIDTTFKLVEDSKLTNVISTTIKPGDIIDVAHTRRTRTNVFLERIFHVTFGAYVPVFQ